jgi:hypothetical protein
MLKEYEVYHEDGGYPTPKFTTWKEALAMQVKWNAEVLGHRARRIDTKKTYNRCAKNCNTGRAK